MSISEYVQTVKRVLNEHLEDLLIILLIVGTTAIGYGLGLMGQGGGQGVALISQFETPKPTDNRGVKSIVSEGVKVGGGEVYASRNGTRYYYPNCAGLARIKPENKISYPNSEAAEATGLTLAANCRK